MLYFGATRGKKKKKNSSKKKLKAQNYCDLHDECIKLLTTTVTF